MESCLYFGRVIHKRLRPFHHKFDYGVFSLWLDLDELDRLPLRLLSHNRFNLMGFSDRDHGPRDGGPLRPWVEAALARAGIDGGGGPIRLLCFPRLLGYVFNPLSIYFCYGPDGVLRAVLHEVKNTFGDQHGYLFAVPADRDRSAAIRQACDKIFYVSPFIGMQARYRFRLREPDERLAVLIRQWTPEGELLVASLHGRRVPLSDRALLSAFCRYPLMTLKVIGAIHWEALRLWLKGAVFHHRTTKPRDDVSIGTSLET